MAAIAEPLRAPNMMLGGEAVGKQDSCSAPTAGFGMIPKEEPFVVTSQRSVPRILPPSRPAPAPPAQEKSLPPTPATEPSPAASSSSSSSSASATYSQTVTPQDHSTQLFHPPPLSPPLMNTNQGFQPFQARVPSSSNNRRRRKSRSPTYLPLSAYPVQHTLSPTYSTYSTYGQYYNTTPPASTPSLSPAVSAHASPLPSHHPSRRSSPTAGPATPPPPPAGHPTLARPHHRGSYPTTPRSHAGSAFSPVPLSSVPLSATSVISGRPDWYAQDQHAQSMTAHQLELQERLEDEEARRRSPATAIAGLIEHAARSLSVSPASTTTPPSPSSTAATTTSPERIGWASLAGVMRPAAAAGGAILPQTRPGAGRAGSADGLVGGTRGGGGGGVGADGLDGKGAWGAVVGFVGGAGKKLGEVEGGVWAWARGKRS